MPTFDTPNSQFSYSPSTGVAAITVEIIGGTGGPGGDTDNHVGGPGGPGGRIVGQLPVSDSETFTGYVGEDGTAASTSAGGQSPFDGGQQGGAGGVGAAKGGSGAAPSAFVRDSDGDVIGVGEGGGGGGGAGLGSYAGGGGGGGARGGAGGPTNGGGADPGQDATGTGQGGDGGLGDGNEGTGGQDGGAGEAGGTIAHADLSVDSTGSSTAAPKVVITEHYPPTTPGNFSVDSVTDTSLDLSWTDPSDTSTTENEDHYDVLLSTDGGSSFTVTKTVAADTTSTTLSGLDNGRTYTGKVRAVTDDGLTRESGTDTDTTVLPDVTGLVLDASVEDQFTAEWDDVSNYGSYRIEWRETGASSWANSVTQGQDDTDRVITGLEDGEQYDVRVRAETPDTESAWATAADVTLLPAPSGFSVVDPSLAKSSPTLDCSWTDNSDNPDEVYRVLVSTDGGSSFSDASGALAANTTSYTFSGQHNTQYVLKARVETEHVIADSGTDTATTSLDHSTGTWIAVVNGDTGSDRRTIDQELIELDYQREHTALSDWRASVPYDPSLEDWVFSDIYIWHDTDLLYRGSLSLVESDEGSATTEIGGYGPERKLQRGASAVSYSTILAWKALEDYLNNHANVDGTVKEPSSQTVTDKQAQHLDTQTEWADATSIPNSVALRAENGDLRTEQTCYFTEAETAYNTVGSSVFSSDYSGGETISITEQFDRVTERFQLERTIKNEDIGLKIRTRVPNAGNPDIRVYVDDQLVSVLPEDELAQDSSPKWRSINADTTADDPDTTDDDEGGQSIGDLSGEVEIKIEVDDPNVDTDPFYVDCIALYDTRFSYTWDTSTDANEALDGPELYPDPIAATETTLAIAESVYSINEATCNLTINETSADQRIGLSFDEGANWTYGTDTSSLTATANVATSTVVAKLRLGRAGSGATSTPTQGYEPMRVDVSEILVDGDTQGVIEDETFDNDHLSNIQKLCKRAGMRVVTTFTEDSISLDAFAEGEKTKSASWKTINRQRKLDTRGYANKMIGKGARQDDGTRLTSTIQDNDEIAAIGETVVHTFVDPSLKTQDDLDSATRTTLSNKLNQDSLTGSIEAAPTQIDPGYSYQVSAWNQTLSAERVTFRLATDDASTAIEFTKPEGLGGDINENAAGIGETKDAI